MTLTQTAPKPATEPKIWEAPTAEAQVGDIIRKPFCPIARVVGKKILADGRTCLIVTFPGCHDRHIEEWVLEYPAPPIAPATPAPTTPKSATSSTPAPATLSAQKTAPVATPAAATKKLLPAIIPIARCTSDIPATNFDLHELEIAGELSLSLGGFIYPPVVRREGNGYKVVAGHFQYHAASLVRKLNPRSGETIPAFIVEADTESALLAQVEILKARKV